MASINLGGTDITYSFGAILALVVLILCVVLGFIGQTLSPLAILGLIGALALAGLC